MTPAWLSKDWRERYAKLLREMKRLERLARQVSANVGKDGGNRPERLTADSAEAVQEK